MADQVVIPARFKGPPDSGHGGYSCAMAAQFVDGPAAEVALRRPPPLECPLDVRREAEAIRLLDRDAVVAEARPIELELEVPEPVGVAEAEQAAGRSSLLDHHPFGSCFVCGTEREPGDGLRLFPGPVEGRRLQAAAWTPDSWMAGEDGDVAFEFVWSVLDCPSGVAIGSLSRNPCVLARFAVRLTAPVEVGAPHVTIGWPISQERRKHHTGAAIFTDRGQLRAYASALWVELTADQLEAAGITQGAALRAVKLG